MNGERNLLPLFYNKTLKTYPFELKVLSNKHRYTLMKCTLIFLQGDLAVNMIDIVQHPPVSLESEVSARAMLLHGDVL